MENGGRTYDRMDVKDRKSGEERSFYFDITIPYNWQKARFAAPGP